MQAQLKELISSMYSTSLGVTSSPYVLFNTPLLPTPDHLPTGVLSAVTVTLLPHIMTTIVSKTLSATFSNPVWTIKWALFYMNAGHVANLVQKILEDDTNMFSNWAAFESWFLSKFMYLDKVKCAALTLEGTSYHQQSHTLNAYIDGFKQLVCC